MTEPVPPLPSDLDPGIAWALESAEAGAYREAYAAAADVVPGVARWEAIGGGAIALAFTAVDHDFFNRAIGLGVGEPATRADVRAIGSFYRAAAITRSSVQLAPGSEPAALTGWLGEVGYAPGGRWVKMWHDLQELADPAPPGPLVTVGPESAEAWADVDLAAFEMPGVVRPLATGPVGRPGWTHYLGLDGGRPVATAAMRIEDGVAWLGYGGTLPAARGRGWQTAMLLRRLVDAKAAGCRLAVTETGEETDAHPVNHSYRNMLRAGFRLAYARRNWNRG